MYITPTEHEKSEWSRMAKDAYSRRINAIGHRYSMAATLRKGESCDLSWFDSLQEGYREWLLYGFAPDGQRPLN